MEVQIDTSINKSLDVMGILLRSECPYQKNGMNQMKLVSIKPQRQLQMNTLNLDMAIIIDNVLASVVCG
jgi:hypothetical protein